MRRGAEAWLAVLVVALSTDFARRHFLQNLVLPEASIGRLAAYTSTTPYQYRVLVPTLVRWLSRAFDAVGLDVPKIVIAVAIDALALVGAFYALRALLGRFTENAYAPVIGALGLYFVLPFQFIYPRNWPYWYPWDIPAVMFTAVGLLLVLTERWRAFYPVYVLASLNRETTCFLTMAFCFAGVGRMPLKQLGLHLAAQTAVWVAIKLTIERIFADHTGYGRYYVHALDVNLGVVRAARNWPLIASNFGFLWLPVAAGYRRIESAFIRRCLWVVPITFAVVFTTAQFDELRTFGEMIPFVLLGVFGVVLSFWGGGRRSRS